MVTPRAGNRGIDRAARLDPSFPFLEPWYLPTDEKAANKTSKHAGSARRISIHCTYEAPIRNGVKITATASHHARKLQRPNTTGSRNFSRAPSKKWEILSEHFSAFAKPHAPNPHFLCNSKRTLRGFPLRHLTPFLGFVVSGSGASREALSRLVFLNLVPLVAYSARSASTALTRAARAAGTADAMTAARRMTNADRLSASAPGWPMAAI